MHNITDKCTLVYGSGNNIWFYLPSMHDGGTKATTLIQNFFGIKAY